MIPIRDTNSSKTIPVVNYTIIGINILIFLAQMSMGQDESRFIYTYGLVPARWSVPEIAQYFSFTQQIFAFVSFMFLHGSFWHLLGNMWSLYIFGDNIEDRLGHFRYLFFYLLCGVISGLTHLFWNIDSNIPTIGASGAIAAVMGAYIVLYPKAKILVFIPIIIVPWIMEIPALFFLGAWFIIQFINAAGTSAGSTGVAWWAHIGGFIAGIVLLRLFSGFPSTGFRERIRPITAKRKTDCVQVIRTVGPGNDPHLYGIITVSNLEAINGAEKIVNIPWGFYKRLVKVTVPPGTQQGTKLRLKGLGKQMPDNLQGDIFLKVVIK